MTWKPVNPCTNCTKRCTGERGKPLPCGNPEVCPEYHVYIGKMAMAKELLEHLIAWIEPVTTANRIVSEDAARANRTVKFALNQILKEQEASQ